MSRKNGRRVLNPNECPHLVPHDVENVKMKQTCERKGAGGFIKSRGARGKRYGTDPRDGRY